MCNQGQAGRRQINKIPARRREKQLLGSSQDKGGYECRGAPTSHACSRASALGGSAPLAQVPVAQGYEDDGEEIVAGDLGVMLPNMNEPKAKPS